ncbi:MAG: HAD-IIB family hydrolase [Candidatus Sedimenticola sp. (ex Thyasira tokunagai)]
MERLLVCTDLDRTLIPNGVQSESPHARQRFCTLISRPEVSLAYVSGRHRELVQQAIALYELPLPDFVIGDVGTTLYRVKNAEQWYPSTEWQQEIGLDWSGSSHQELKQLFIDFSDLRPQEPSKQNRYKLSYYLPLQADHHQLLLKMQSRLEHIGVRANLIWSLDEPAGIGLLDVLPARASKLHAIEFLMGQEGFNQQEMVFAGDSGNDMEVLVSNLPAVLVANSPQDIQTQARQGAERNGNLQQLYLANGNGLGMNGNYAAGILEGIAHFHPSVRSWFSENYL